MSPPLLTFPEARLGDLVVKRQGTYVITWIAYDSADQFYVTGVRHTSGGVFDSQVLMWGGLVIAR